MSAVATTSPAALRRRLRRPAQLALVVVAIAVVVTIVRGSSSEHDLDPASPAKDGARALAVLLADRGSPVRRVPEPPPSPAESTGYVIADPQLLPTHDIGRALDLARTNDVVVIVASADRAEQLGVDATPRTSDETDPGCSLPAATAAGRVTRLALEIVGRPEGFTRTDRCYEGGLVRYAPLSGDGSLTVVGGTRWLTNRRLGDNGHAALAINLIAGHPHTDWVLPLPGEVTLGSDEGGFGLSRVLPHGVRAFGLQLLLATLLLAVAVGRRLGPVVTERLPVAVRGTETSRGRARLWAGAKAHDRAALALREHARAGLASSVGLGPTSTADALVGAVSERSGRPADAVRDVLFGAPPATDAGLARLADDLSDLTATLRHQGAP